MKTIIISLITAVALSMNLRAQDASSKIEPSGIFPDSVLTNKNKPEYKAKEITRIGKKQIWVVEAVEPESGKKNINTGKQEKNGPVKFKGHWKGIGVGYNGFDKPDYSMYNGTEFMRLNQGKSLEVDVNLWQVNIGLFKSYIGLVSGMGLGFNNYRFEEPYTIIKGSQITEAFPLNWENLSKTKLALSYLQVPLLLEIQIPVNYNESRLFVNAGIIGGVKIGSHTKVKHGDIKDKDHNNFNINPFKYSATARIGYKKIGLFGTYSLTPLFESGKGPELTPFTIGICYFGSK